MSPSSLHDLLKKTKSKPSAAQKQYIETFYKSVPDEDMDIMNRQIIAETAMLHHEMAQGRITGETKIQVHTPDIDNEEWGTGRTVINIVNDDIPFLVDSIAAEITQNFKLIHLLIHPILYVSRDKNGAYKGLTKAKDKDALRESHIHIELQGKLPSPTMKKLEKRLYKIIEDVRYATKDWQAMRKKLKECQKGLANAPRKTYPKDLIEEYTEFLDYLHDNNFTLLGYRAYKFSEKSGEVISETVKGESLGLLHDDVTPVFVNDDDRGLPGDLQKMRRDMLPLSIAKVNKRSTVHRAVPLDSIAVKQFDKAGKITGEMLFIGLFTSVTYSRSIQDVPLLRRKARMVMEKSGYQSDSHDYKALRHVLEKYPRDELFQMKIKEILKTGISIMRLQERQRIALYVRPDPFGRYVSCLVYVPRDRYDTRLRIAVQNILRDSFDGQIGDFYTNLDDSPLARLMFVIYVKGKKKPVYSRKKIEAKLQKAGQLWSEALAEELLVQHGDNKQSDQYILKYANAFPTNYSDNYEPKQAVFDIEHIDHVLNNDTLALDLYKCKKCSSKEIRLKVFHAGTPIILSDILPILENMGLRVVAEMPFEIKPDGSGQSVWIHDFEMQLENGEIIDLGGSKAVFEEALLKTWRGDVEDDELNAMAITTGMDWRDIMILRACTRYIRQTGSTYGLPYMAQSLNNHPEIALKLVRLFKTLHDPAAQDKAEANAKKIRKDIQSALESVSSLDEDKIIQQVQNIIDSTLRTNFFQKDEQGNLKPYIALKLKSGSVKDLPKPVPYREIFVYAPNVEGIHLRGDVIARGGLRWSDRHEDFRTEVLGLMKAQQVKNAVIVPMGAKGGFVVKNPPKDGGREAFLKEGIECYKRFVGALLEITDNRKGKKVIPPRCVVRHDGDDPYLVVAADKGTASFSDIANSLSKGFEFWLGDAFASGGSAGYDHKKMGITARGAWESVKRHFRELNHDIQSKDFTVIGVGDMGGDVFGNGMILSKHIKLIGAFNHLHIFCDPDPNPETTFKERKRLFDNVKGWDEYNEKLLSKGGRIFSRKDKSLKLTPEIKAAFKIEQDSVDPNTLIKAMLKTRCDLLWFGGIGTYIKASHESHSDVGDKGNDGLRINANELCAKVIGEGANLAITQAARVEFSQNGGRLNADFIDNSGGVDSSDHEVNIKILLGDVMLNDKHKMDLKKRNKLLEKMTDEVARLVLRNNYQQAQGLTMMEMRAVKALPDHAALIRELEKKYGLDRAVEGLPDDEEIERRIQQEKGLTRPELAILLAYSKINFAKSLLKTDLPDLEEMEDYWLAAYFPSDLRKKYREEIKNHRLRREIIATTMSNSLINRMGPLFIKKINDKTGASDAEIARAYVAVRESFDMRSYWDAIEALDGKVASEVQLTAMQNALKVIERETIWVLTKLGRKVDLDKDVKDYSKGIDILQNKLDSLVPQELQQNIKLKREAALENGFPKDLAGRVARITKMGASFDIIRLSMDCKADLELTARLYFAVGNFYKLEWLRSQARNMDSDGAWAAQALNSILDQLYDAQVGLTELILQKCVKDGLCSQKSCPDAFSIIKDWMGDKNAKYEAVTELLDEIVSSGNMNLSMLIVVSQRLNSLYNL